MLGLSLLPVHANYPRSLRPPPSEPNTTNGNLHNLLATNTLPHNIPPQVCGLD